MCYRTHAHTLTYVCNNLCAMIYGPNFLFHVVSPRLLDCKWRANGKSYVFHWDCFMGMGTRVYERKLCALHLLDRCALVPKSFHQCKFAPSGDRASRTMEKANRICHTGITVCAKRWKNYVRFLSCFFVNFVWCLCTFHCALRAIQIAWHLTSFTESIIISLCHFSP